MSTRRPQVLWRDRFICQYCGSTGDDLIAEHMIPRARHNTNAACNLTTACERCNRLKWCYTPAEWRAVTEILPDGHPRKVHINPIIGKVVDIEISDSGLVPCVITTVNGMSIIAAATRLERHIVTTLDAVTICGDIDDLYKLQPLPSERKRIEFYRQYGLEAHS